MEVQTSWGFRDGEWYTGTTTGTVTNGSGPMFYPVDRGRVKDSRR